MIRTMIHQAKAICFAVVSDDKSTMKLLPELEIDGTTTIGVRVGSEGQDDFDLYFSKETKLLRRTIGKHLCPDQKVHPFTEDTLDYKNFNGLKMATKKIRTVEGIGVFEECISEVEYIPTEKVPLVFKKP